MVGRKLPALLLPLVFGLPVASLHAACSYDDDNGDGLVLSSGRALISGPSTFTLDHIAFQGNFFDGVTVGLDVNTVRWSITPPFPAAGPLDLRTAAIRPLADNAIRLSGLTFAGERFNATIVINLDGTFSVQDVAPWSGGDSLVSEDSVSRGVGAWTSSGGQDVTSASNPRYTLSICDTREIAVEVTSNVDTFLYLLDSNGQVIAFNDDIDFDANILNSRIVMTLEPGVYTIVVGTFMEREAGVFELSAGPGEPDVPGGPGGAFAVLNLRAIPGTDFVDFASLGGRVTDAQTGAAIAGAEVLVFAFIPGNPDVTVFTDSGGSYFLRVFATRLAANTFNALVSAEGCNQSPAAFGIVNINNHATIDFRLNCNRNEPGAGGGTPGGNGSLAVELTEGQCTISQVSATGAEFRLTARGTASGSVDTRFEFNWTENPGIEIQSCGAWTFRPSQQDCIRGPNDPETTTWSGGDTVTLPLGSISANESRVITPFVNAGGRLRSTHPANLELAPFTIACR